MPEINKGEKKNYSLMEFSLRKQINKGTDVRIYL